MATRTAVFKLCVTALTLLRLIPSCGAEAPTNKKQFTRLISNLEMINADLKPCVFTKKKIVFSFQGCHQKYPFTIILECLENSEIRNSCETTLTN